MVDTQLTWYLRRLEVMPVAEIPHRAVELVRRRQMRHQPAVQAGPAALGAAPAAGVLATWLIDRCARDPASRQRAQLALDQLLSHRVDILGTSWRWQGETPDFSVDPVTGRSWSRAFTFDIDYRRSAAGLGDVKYAWEINRLQYLLGPATVAATSGDPRAAAVIGRHVRAWSDQTPRGCGVAWSSAIECALRIVTLVALSELCPDAVPLHRVAPVLVDHVAWIRVFPSLHSSANNHRVAELGALLVATRSVGLDAGSDDALLEEFLAVARAQYAEDGVGREQSPSYAAFSLEWILLVLRLYDDHSSPHVEPLKEVAARAGRALLDFCDRSGNCPRIGDDDEGRVLLTCLSGRDRVVHDVACASGARPQGEGLTTFRAGGYTIARDRCAQHEVLWILDHGELGMRPLAAHGHADPLAVWLHVGGAPVLVDTGTYLYHAGGAWRRYVRSTRAHNTLQIDDAEHSLPFGNFGWQRRQQSEGRLRHADAGETNWHVTASHDGYVRSLGIQHVRRVMRTGVATYLVEDRLEGCRSALPVTARFHFAPDLRVVPASGGSYAVTGRAGPRVLTVDVHGHDDAVVARGGDHPDGGWHSRCFGELEPIDTLLVSGRLDGSTSLRTVWHISNGQPSGEEAT